MCMFMNIRYFVLLWAIILPLFASAQASGGQVSRPTIHRNNKSSHTQKSSKKNQTKVYSHSSSFEFLTKNQLSEYNVIALTFSFLDNAKTYREVIEQAGYDAKIYLDTQGKYQIVVGSFNDRLDALNRLYLLRAKGYPDAWIMSIENEQEYRYR